MMKKTMTVRKLLFIPLILFLVSLASFRPPEVSAGAGDLSIDFVLVNGSSGGPVVVTEGDQVKISVAVKKNVEPAMTYDVYAWIEEDGTWSDVAHYIDSLGAGLDLEHQTWLWWDTSKIPHGGAGGGTYPVRATLLWGIGDNAFETAYYWSGTVEVLNPSPGNQTSVGGVVVPVDKLGLLAPYMGLVSTIMVPAVAITISVKRVKRRKDQPPEQCR